MLYRFIRWIAWLLAHLLYRPRVTGTENIPKKGAFLLCSNHIHAFDPIALAVCIKRRPRYMAKKELFEGRKLGAFLRALGAFPVDRTRADMQAYRNTLDILKQGQGIIIFFQGTRMTDFENTKSGVAVFALKSGAPIIPVGIRGSYRLWSKVHVHFGRPISMDGYRGRRVKTELVEEVMETVVARVSALAAGK